MSMASRFLELAVVVFPILSIMGSLPGLVTKLGYTTLELNGKMLGLVGAGKIARRLAQICSKVFNMDVCAYDAFLPHEDIKEAGIKPCETLEEVFKKADFISVHCRLRLTPRTLSAKNKLT